VDEVLTQRFAIAFPVFFVAMWLAVTTVLSLFSGWFQLSSRFPDQFEEPNLVLRGQSGAMGPGVSMRGILTLAVCASGIRVGINRLFGPFNKRFFVPWREVSVTRSTSFLLWPVAKLQFGSPAIGSLTVASHVANKLARASGKQWPESGPLPEEEPVAVVQRLVVGWGAATVFAAAFFILVPTLMAPSSARPPVIVAILFPAVVLGIGALVQYFRLRE
jgi:hypothetical protein